MRIIKFRGKGVGDGDWHYGSYLYTDNNVNNPYLTTPPVGKHQIFEYCAGDFLMGGWEGIEVYPETIGQFTCLYDKNGNEIYEGDILSYTWGTEPDVSSPSNDYLEVRFVRGVFAFLWNGDLDDECAIDSPTLCWATVVGNIHDNPDLIKNN